MKPPEALQRALEYANAVPTEETWRGVVLGPFAQIVLEPGAEPPKVPTFGVRSLDELEKILGEFRKFLSQWIRLQGPYTLEAESLLTALNERAHLRFKRWWLDATSGRLIDELETEQSSFTEFLYATLGLALKEASFREIYQCDACGKFFYNRSSREVKFCSGACRNRTMVRRHRQRTSEKQTRTRPTLKRHPKPNVRAKG